MLECAESTHMMISHYNQLCTYCCCVFVQGEEEECGFCLFMKAGPCGKRFAAWEACVDNADTVSSKIVEKCAQMTHFLKDCMVSYPEYYGPVLQAEKAMDEQAELEGAQGGEQVQAENIVNSLP